MTDTLRTRIANAAGDFLSDNFHAYLEQGVALELADAVIAQLGLSREWGRLDPTDSGAIYDSLEDALAAIDLPNEKLRTRLITDWVDVQQG